MKVTFSKFFQKRLQKLPVKTREKFRDRLRLFIQDRFDPSLSNHTLHGEYREYHSIRVTGDIRALYRMDGDVCVFEIIGTHSELYG